MEISAIALMSDPVPSPMRALRIDKTGFRVTSCSLIEFGVLESFGSSFLLFLAEG